MSRAGEVYEAVASALAGAHEPDLSPYGGAEVRGAMADVLGTDASREAFLTWLEDRVRILSGGRVSVETLASGDDPLAVELRLGRTGETFAEPVVLRIDPVRPLEFPMRGA